MLSRFCGKSVWGCAMKNQVTGTEKSRARSTKSSASKRHIGFVIPEVKGHLNPAMSVALELQQRGNQVSFVGTTHALASCSHGGIPLIEVGAQYQSTLGGVVDQLGKSSGVKALYWTLLGYKTSNSMLLSELPQVVRQQKFDALVIDQTLPAAATVADYLQTPYYSFCAALPLLVDHRIPPPIFSWGYGESKWQKIRNRFGLFLQHAVAAPVLRAVNRQRRLWNLSPHRHSNQFLSPFGTIAQQQAELEFRVFDDGPKVHYVGPLFQKSLRNAAFPWHRVREDVPLFYASLGSLQNNHAKVFEIIEEACQNISCQLVIATGRENSPFTPHYKSTIALPFVPQLDLIQRASLVIGHGGLNTTLESLYHGVPLVMIPIANEQPGIASRCRHHGLAEVISPRSLTVEKLQEKIIQVTTLPHFRRNAALLAQKMKQNKSVELAANLIESLP
jgi:zeaxanthin glucosyltransferase